MKRRRLGQHYLTDGGVVERIISEAHIVPGERVLEIGTGRGVLTKVLAGLGTPVEAYEIDRENFEATAAALGSNQVKLQLGDAFESRAGFDVLVSSLPYSESSRFVEWLSGIEYDRAVVLLQEDFVRKILAPPGSRDYRAISALAQMSSSIIVVSKVGRESFSPRPRVESVIVKFVPRARLSTAEVRFVNRLFSLRRRQVAAALSELQIEGDGDYGRRRVFSLSPEEVRRLFPQRTD